MSTFFKRKAFWKHIIVKASIMYALMLGFLAFKVIDMDIFLDWKAQLAYFAVIVMASIISTWAEQSRRFEDLLDAEKKKKEEE